MPGICGIVQEPASALGETIADMQRAMTHEAWYGVEHRADDEAGVALGRVALNADDVGSQPAEATPASSRAVLHGEIYESDGLRRELQQAGHACRSDSPAEVLLQGYLAEGKKFLKRINGKFSAAIWDGRGGRLILTNDCFGMQPLYYAHVGGRLLFASEIKSLLLDEGACPDVNPKGLAQFFSFGHLWNEETLYESVRVLPAGAWLTYEPASDRLHVEQYHRFAAPQPDAAIDRGELLDRLDAAFQRAVDVRTLNTEHLGLSLSGGLDARSILGVMDCRRTPVTSVCMGIEGSLDHRSSQQLAALAGSGYHAYTLNDRFLSRFEEHLRRMVLLTDGHYLSQCIVMPTLPFYRDLGIRVLLRGHGGELLHMQKAYNFSLDAAGMSVGDENTLKNWLASHLRAYMLEGVDGALFAGLDRGELDALAGETIAEALAPTADWRPQAQRIAHLFITQRLRRETAMSLVKFGSAVETRLPYVDRDLVSLLIDAPIDLKRGEAIQTHILQKRRSEFLKVTNVNTGSRVGAGRLTRQFNSLRMRVLAKLGVKGYQPYERLGLWLRRELKPLVRKILLGERCLQRGVFRPETVRKVVEQHFKRQSNHTFLIMAMMIFELGRQMFADGDAAVAASPAAQEQYA